MVPNQAVLPSAPQWSLQANPLRTDIRLLFQAAMLVFVITVAIGILNGLHLVGQLSQDVLLTHVHAGTLGWITLSVFAVSLWLFGDGKAPTEKSSYVRVMSILAAVCIPLYVLAFLSGNFIARAVFGFPVLLLMIAFFGWIVARSLRVRLTVARLALLGALFTLIVGSVIGVLLQIQFATSNAFLPAGAFAAHPATQVVGYLLLVGMAISEWRFMPNTGRLPRAGVIQIAFPFIAGLVLTIGTLLNNNALLGHELRHGWLRDQPPAGCTHPGKNLHPDHGLEHFACSADVYPPYAQDLRTRSGRGEGWCLGIPVIRSSRSEPFCVWGQVLKTIHRLAQMGNIKSCYVVRHERLCKPAEYLITKKVTSPSSM